MEQFEARLILVTSGIDFSSPHLSLTLNPGHIVQASLFPLVDVLWIGNLK